MTKPPGKKPAAAGGTGSSGTKDTSAAAKKEAFAKKLADELKRKKEERELKNRRRFIAGGIGAALGLAWCKSEGLLNSGSSDQVHYLEAQHAYWNENPLKHSDINAAYASDFFGHTALDVIEDKGRDGEKEVYVVPHYIVANDEWTQKEAAELLADRERTPDDRIKGYFVRNGTASPIIGDEGLYEMKKFVRGLLEGNAQAKGTGKIIDRLPPLGDKYVVGYSCVPEVGKITDKLEKLGFKDVDPSQPVMVLMPAKVDATEWQPKDTPNAFSPNFSNNIKKMAQACYIDNPGEGTIGEFVLQTGRGRASNSQALAITQANLYDFLDLLKALKCAEYDRLAIRTTVTAHTVWPHPQTPEMDDHFKGEPSGHAR